MVFFFLIIYSYLSNFFIPHTKIHNFIILIIGFVFFIANFIINKKEEKKKIIIFYFTLIILFISILIFKNHDDFEYYHFPYTYLLTQNDLIIGLGNFGHGFRTQSSIFYLNSIFYLPYIDYYLFNLGAVLILFFTNLILLDYVFGNFGRKKLNLNNKFFQYFSLLAIIFINIFFYRISEHGTDRSSQILIFLLFIEIIYFLNIKPLSQYKLTKVYLLLGIIVSFKAFFILYLITFILLFVHIFKNVKKITKTINFFLVNKFFLFFLSLIFLILITNILNTGCFIYPVYFTCFENFNWSIPIEQVKEMNNWYELWSKAGAGPDFRVLNKDIYIQDFNWINNWFNIYFFNKVTDLLFGLFFLCILFFFIFNRHNKKATKKIKYIKSVYVLISFLFIEWFIVHPALRYGGYVLVSLLFFIPLSFKLNNSSIKSKDFFKKAIAIIIIVSFIFLLRNIVRINNEFEKYRYKPFQNVFYKVDEKHFRIQKKLEIILERNDFCNDNQNMNECLGEINKTSKIFGKTVIENR